MRYVFPCDIVLDRQELLETGRRAFNVKFPDVYGANTCGWSWEEAIDMAKDCLGVALGMYMKAGEDIPEAVLKAGELTRYALLTRYPGPARPVTEDEYEAAAEIAEAVVEWAGKRP